jgi:hypothetical protein
MKITRHKLPRCSCKETIDGRTLVCGKPAFAVHRLDYGFQKLTIYACEDCDRKLSATHDAYQRATGAIK